MNKPTILCVDNERNVLVSLRDQLIKCFPDYAIVVAESGDEALAIVEELLANGIEVPLVIADQLRSDKSGEQVLIELHARHPQTVKVMLTGQASVEGIGDVLNRGNLYRLMFKPWHEIDLNLTVTEAIRRYKQETEGDRKQSELMLQSLMESTASLTGSDFFVYLAEGIAKALDVSHVYISKKVGEILEPLAVYYDQQIHPNSIYQTANTPCLESMQRGNYYCPKDVQSHFPNDPNLVEMEVDSYLGLALKNESGETIGVFCILNRTAITNLKRAEILLNFFASRAAAELVRLQQSEIDLQESNERFRATFEQAAVGICQNSLDGKYMQMNQRFCAIMGYSEIELLIKSFTELTHPDDLEKDDQQTRLLVKGELQSFTMEKRYIRKDGEIVWANLAVSLARNLNGEPQYFIGIVQDISDRKRAELELARLLQELSQLNVKLEEANHQLEDYSQTLEQRVQERTNELKSAQERIIAQEKLASLGTLTAGIAHEMRNPLNFVKNYAEGSIELSQELLENLQPIFSAQEPQTASLIEALINDLQENASTIHRHSLRAAEIIDSMMQHSRSEPAPMQPTRLNTLLDEAVKLTSHSKRVQDINFNVSIHTNYDPEVDLVDVISNTLMRAFINLIDNAYDAMYSKQIQLKVYDLQPNPYIPSLTVSTQLMEEKVEICIRDNGCGLAPQIQSKVIDPFFTTKPPGAGTGLGLSITQDIIVKQHQGTLEISSELNEFTEILIAIPLHSPNIQSFALK
jgi:PAS domain S-box-containing protein